MKTNEEAISRKEAQKTLKGEACFSILRFSRLFMGMVFLFIGCPSSYSATEFEKITANMGGIDFNGLPKLSFEIVDRQDAGELAALGLKFTLRHQTRLQHGRTAGTEWSLPCPQTCAHIDTQGNVVWLAAGGRTVYFNKTDRGYTGVDSSATATVSPDRSVIEITTPALIKWRYRNGFLESIYGRSGYYSVTMDRGIICSISKKILDREIFLLKCAYSKQGFLGEMEFPGGRKYRLHWSANHALMAIDGPEGRRFDFEYTGSLLTCWTRAGGPRNELKWWYFDYVRETAFQIPPVLLREDGSYSYMYRVGKWGSVDTVKVHDKTGALASETRIGSAGVEQITPGGTIKYIFK